MTAALVTLWRLNSWAKMRYSFHKLLFSLTIEPGPLLGCGVAVWRWGAGNAGPPAANH